MPHTRIYVGSLTILANEYTYEFVSVELRFEDVDCVKDVDCSLINHQVKV